MGVSGGYNWMADFAHPICASNNYSGAEFKPVSFRVFWLGRRSMMPCAGVRVPGVNVSGR